MATIVTRAGKGEPLTHVEVDANFTNLNADKLENGSTVASLDINGGTIDGTVIGGTTAAAISGTTGAFSGDVTLPSINGGPLAGFRNAIINGNFDHWQRGTSGTSGYVADRWANGAVGTSATQSRQAFALGQTDVPNEPKYFARVVVSSVAGAGNLFILETKVEGVRTFAGQTATFSFYAKADAAKNIAVEFAQYFGAGGSPSASVTGIGVTTLSLTTAWQKFTVTVAIPSISGKTLGTSDNDYLAALFWLDAGSDYNARTNSLGQQSGTFDIAQVQLEAGSVATPFERRPVETELALCQRYYEKSFAVDVAPANNLGPVPSGSSYLSSPASGGGFSPNMYWTISYKTPKRGVAAITFYNPNSATASTWATWAATAGADVSPVIEINALNGFSGNISRASTTLAAGAWTADSEL